MTALSPEAAQILAEHGVDTANILTVGKQAAYAILINTASAGNLIEVGVVEVMAVAASNAEPGRNGIRYGEPYHR